MPAVIATTFLFLSFSMAIVGGIISYCSGIGHNSGKACDDLKSRLSDLEREKVEVILGAQEREMFLGNETAYWKDKSNSLEIQLGLSRRENEALVHTNEVNEMKWNGKLTEKDEQLRNLKEVADEKTRVKDQSLAALRKKISETNNMLTRERENGRLMRDSLLEKQRDIEALRQSMGCSHQVEVLAVGKEREELNKEKELFKVKEKKFEGKVSELETEKRQLLLQVRRFQKDEAINKLSHLGNNEKLMKENLDCQRRLEEKDRRIEQLESVAEGASEATKRNAQLADEMNETLKMIEDVKHSLTLERTEYEEMKREEGHAMHEREMSLSKSMKANMELQEYLQREKGELAAQRMACEVQLQKAMEILRQEKSKQQAALSGQAATLNSKRLDFEEEKSKMEAAKRALEKKVRREMSCIEQHQKSCNEQMEAFFTAKGKATAALLDREHTISEKEQSVSMMQQAVLIGMTTNAVRREQLELATGQLYCAEECLRQREQRVAMELNKAAKIKAEAESMITSLQEQLQLLRENASLTADKTALKEAAQAKGEAEKEEKETEVIQLQEVNLNLNEYLQSLRQEVATYKSENAAAAEMMSNLRKEKDNLNKTIDEVCEERNKLVKRCEELHTKKLILGALSIEWEHEQEVLERNLKTAEDEKKTLSDQILLVTEEKRQLHLELSRTKKELLSLKDEGHQVVNLDRKGGLPEEQKEKEEEIQEEVNLLQFQLKDQAENTDYEPPRKRKKLNSRCWTSTLDDDLTELFHKSESLKSESTDFEKSSGDAEESDDSEGQEEAAAERDGGAKEETAADASTTVVPKRKFKLKRNNF
ncbi:myosin-7-like [Macrobrachium nipponense]|uniref:myosin-7-like n=1 Tax=Macrobrachium nipponense TaxID=159736 RepID=UPI0030C7D4E5